MIKSCQLTCVTAGAVGRPTVHTLGTGVVTEVALPSGLVPPRRATGHTLALVQEPGQDIELF